MSWLGKTKRWLILSGALAFTFLGSSALLWSGPALPVFPSVEEATPDCGSPPPDDDPHKQRFLHLDSLGVNRWHAAGVRGKGVKIAILDTGFRGYREQMGKALPAKVIAKSFRADGSMETRDSQHGILCSEVLHALAPDAELILATWDPYSAEQFLQAAQWARSQGAKLISCSVIMPSWSDGEGGGPVHEALSKILGPGDQTDDLLYFASAGNTARRHWSGTYHEGADHFHEWTAGHSENRIRPWGTDRVSIELCCKGGCKYNVEVRDLTTNAEVGAATTSSESKNGCAVVRFNPNMSHNYQARVRLIQGPAKPFHFVALGGDLDIATASGSIPFPGDGPEVVAIGAVDGDGKRASYSSCGPNSLAPKPDFVAPVPFPSFYRDRPFTGTSAAAPQAAALAALCWSKHPEWNADQVRQALRRWAKDLGPPGHDWETGFGLVTLPAPTDEK